MNPRERIEQVIHYGLPVKMERGNRLKEEEGKIFGFLDGDIPEIGIHPTHSPFNGQRGDKEFFLHDLNTNCSQGLSLACEGRIKKEEFIVEVNRNKFITANKVEIHAFYDPNKDTTYYFPMPSRELTT